MPESSTHFYHKGSPDIHATVDLEPVVEQLPNNVEVLPTTERPGDIGHVALVAAEQIQAPEADVQQVEFERKNITMENLRALQKRFGERFVKGDLMEGGGYTGGAARELLAGFMDRPGFSDELRRLIPGKHGALRLLKDNHAYIQATLEQRYKYDPSNEKAPARDPYELARSVGYELTGPFTSTAEFVALDRRDFRQNAKERLCTFNNPEGRLKDYYILWLRHAEVSDTLPADQLTADTLSEAWKTYLKTIGRYDRDTDSYDLSGLRPNREDPYGISSMSVQISCKGTHVSIKNRYNHTVGNPDNTLDSDLDNVAYGLKRAVYARVGREDLMYKRSVALAESYIADNEGGIHHYQYEEDNVYYGDYEYINNGVVTVIDRGKYYMISPQLYVPISGKGDELRLGQRAATSSAGLEVSSDVRFLFKSSRLKYSEKDQHIAELRRTYAERDHAELKVLTVEHVRSQVQSSYTAYKRVADNLLGTKRGLFGNRDVATSIQEIEQLFASKDKDWQANGVYDYLAEKLITDGSRFTLVATPNVETNEAQVVALAEAFGKGQPNQTYVYDDLYRKRHYKGREWSGNKGNEPIRLSLIPSRFDSEMGNNRVDAQVGQLHERQAKQPELGIHVPTLLEAITYWYSLRAQDDKLNDNSAFDKTYIRHFDLEPKTAGRWSLVPNSYVDDDGGPKLYFSNADYGNSARLAVG